MKETLNKSVGSDIYHFTTIDAMGRMLFNNEIVLTPLHAKLDVQSQYNTNYNYFLSLTREPNPSLGYPGSKNQEKNKTILPDFNIDLEIVKINNNNEAKKYKDIYIYTNKKGEKYGVYDKNKNLNYNIIREKGQFEERILSNKECLSGLYNLVKRIDIFTEEISHKVRITFDANKLKDKYKIIPVDYLSTKYAEEKRKKMKELGISVVNESNNLNALSLNEWDILRNFCEEAYANLKKHKSEKSEFLISWSEKIFMHYNGLCKSWGSNLLYNIKDNIKDKSKWVSDVMKYSKKMADLEHVALEKGDLLLLANAIYFLTPPRKDIPNNKRLADCKKKCEYYFGEIKIIYNNKLVSLGNKLKEIMPEAFSEIEMKISNSGDNLKRVIEDILKKCYNNVKINTPTGMALRRKINGTVIIKALRQMFYDFDKENNRTVGDYPTFIYKNYYQPLYGFKIDNRGRKEAAAKSFKEDSTDSDIVNEETVKKMSIEVLKKLHEGI